MSCGCRASAPDGTPFAVLDGRPVDSETLYDADALVALIRG
jgi:hypothetical protein